MLLAPLAPESDNNSLQNPGERRSEESAPDAKEFRTSKECKQGDDRVEADCLTDDARADQFALDHMNDHKVGQYPCCSQPAMREANGDTECTRNNGAQHRNEGHYKGQRAQEDRIM